MLVGVCCQSPNGKSRSRKPQPVRLIQPVSTWPPPATSARWIITQLSTQGHRFEGRRGYLVRSPLKPPLIYEYCWNAVVFACFPNRNGRRRDTDELSQLFLSQHCSFSQCLQRKDCLSLLDRVICYSAFEIRQVFQSIYIIDQSALVGKGLLFYQSFVNDALLYRFSTFPDRANSTTLFTRTAALSLAFVLIYAVMASLSNIKNSAIRKRISITFGVN
jgi:hypothetical protein